MKFNYFDMPKSERQLIWKMVTATLICNFITWLMNDIYSMTAVVTSYLFLWTDRGYKNNVLYGKKRVLVQLVQGVMVIAIVFPCKYFKLPIPDIALITIATCATIILGLILNYKYKYSWISATLVCASVIITLSVIRDMNSFPKRVMNCIIGALVGYFVNYIIFSNKDRVKEIMQLTRESVHALVEEIDFDTYAGNITLIEKEIGLLIADEGRNGRKGRVSEGEITALQKHRQLLVSLKNFLETYGKYEEQLSDSFKQEVLKRFKEVTTLHKELLEREDYSFGAARTLEFAKMESSRKKEICVMGRLLEYEECFS